MSRASSQTLLETADRSSAGSIPLLCLGAFAGIQTARDFAPFIGATSTLSNVRIDMSRRADEKGPSSLRGNQRHPLCVAPVVRREIRHPVRPGLRMVRHLVCSQCPFESCIRNPEYPLKPNALRHSFASYHLAEHGDIDALVIALGHRGNPTVLWEHYHRAVKKSAAKAFWAIRPAEAAQKTVAIG